MPPCCVRRMAHRDRACVGCCDVYGRLVSRGVVLWPDDESSLVVRHAWDELAKKGLPSLAGYTHRRHRPHVSLTVGQDLPVEEALRLLGAVPAKSLRLLVESAGVFPGGVLFLACVATQELLDEQRRVHELVKPGMVGPWPHFTPGSWTPHITCGVGCRPEQVGAAVSVLLDLLPLQGCFEQGGIEDGTTGDSWPARYGGSHA